MVGICSSRLVQYVDREAALEHQRFGPYAQARISQYLVDFILRVANRYIQRGRLAFLPCLLNQILGQATRVFVVAEFAGEGELIKCVPEPNRQVGVVGSNVFQKDSA